MYILLIIYVVIDDYFFFQRKRKSISMQQTNKFIKIFIFNYIAYGNYNILQMYFFFSFKDNIYY